MENKRIDWIDTAKGIGIFLVVLGHTALPYSIFRYIFSFHMPLFFFISGFLFNPQKHSNFSEFLKKRFLRLIFPYFIFSLVLYLYWLIIGRYYGLVIDSNISIFKPILDILYSSNHLFAIFTPLWFLTCLFLTEILYFFIGKFKSEYKLITLLSLAILGFVLARFLPFRLPWSVDILPISILFYGLGEIYRDFQVNTSKISAFAIIISCLIIGYFGSMANTQTDMIDAQYGNPFLMVSLALLGIIMIFTLGKNLNNKILQFLGKNSLYIFAFHQIFLGLGREIWNKFFPINKIDFAGQENILPGLILCLFALICLSVVILALEKINKTLKLNQK